MGQLNELLQKFPEYVEFTMDFTKKNASVLYLDKADGDKPYTICQVLKGTPTDDGHWEIGIKTTIDNHKKVIMCIYVAEFIPEVQRVYMALALNCKINFKK